MALLDINHQFTPSSALSVTLRDNEERTPTLAATANVTSTKAVVEIKDTHNPSNHVALKIEGLTFSEAEALARFFAAVAQDLKSNADAPAGRKV